jgi:multiple sugar transport system substrate-binding protein
MHKLRVFASVAAIGCLALISTALFARAQTAKTEVTFWTSHTEPDLTSLKNIVENFNKTSSTITVKLVKITGTETDTAKLTTAVAGGTGPDVYMLDRFIVAERAAAGFLQELDEFTGKDAVKPASEHLPFAWAETQFKGKTYALPFDTDTRVLYYRKDILKQAGVNPEQLDPSKGVPSLKLISNISAKLNTKDSQGNYTRIGFVPWPNQGWHYTWGFAFNGSFYDAASCKVTPTDKGVVAGFQYLYDYAKALDPKKVAAFVSTYYPPNYPAAQEPFITGRQPMVITGDWMIANMAKYAPKADWGVTYIPTADGHKTSWAGGWSMVTPKGAKHPAEAYEFMKYITGPEGQSVYVKETAHLPTVKSLLGNNSLFEKRHLFFKDLLTSAKSRPAIPVGALYWDQLTSAMNKVTLNQATPMDALSQVATRVNQQLQKFCK